MGALVRGGRNLTRVFMLQRELKDKYETKTANRWNASYNALFAAFGWHVQNVNGHDCGAIQSAVNVAKNQKGKPSVIILDTEKGNIVADVEKRQGTPQILL